MSLDSHQVDLRVSIDTNYLFTFRNASEAIVTSPAAFKGDSFYLELPVYGTYLTGIKDDSKAFHGHWTNTQKSADYQIPFTAQHISSAVSDLSPIATTTKYEVSFSPNSEHYYPSLAIINSHSDGTATGTFLTETGDYRYLEGFITDDYVNLDCFDGSHLFYFEGHIQQDSIVDGLFRSGTHWTEPWNARINENYALTDPYHLTQVIDNSPIELNLVNTSGDFETLTTDYFKNHVTIVQILGTWCPNCLDESIFYKELHEKYSSQGLQIVPVAFEKSDDYQTSALTLKRYLRQLELPYDGYVGGKASKKTASEAFPMLSEIISFPTSLIIDKEGNIHTVHTGFYGPGTGQYYDQYVNNTESLIEELLMQADS
ncbi:MAG: TlpA family protein disulfide reductase [Flavobacteriales bacterium]|nr:TlpA family protein disulfide reductase [Flavobacteriales bacterium]